MPNSKLFSEFLSINGEDNTHSITNANATLTTFSIAPAAGKVLELNRILITVQDSGVIDATDYGAIAGGLTNGMTLSVHDADGLKYLLTDSHKPIKTNVDWGAYCYDVEDKSWGTGDNFLVARWTFAKSGKPVYLRGDRSERLVLETADTMSALVEHLVLAQGYYITP